MGAVNSGSTSNTQTVAAFDITSILTTWTHLNVLQRLRYSKVVSLQITYYEKQLSKESICFLCQFNYIYILPILLCMQGCKCDFDIRNLSCCLWFFCILHWKNILTLSIQLCLICIYHIITGGQNMSQWYMWLVWDTLNWGLHVCATGRASKAPFYVGLCRSGEIHQN